MRVLVTGSAGRVGRAIYIKLSREHQVQGLDRTPSSTSDYVGDIGDPSLLRNALAGVDAVIHVAALHAPHVAHVSETEFERVNVHHTHRLLDACANAGVRRLVFTSTTALYGTASTPDGHAGWVDETTPPQPITIYHRTKSTAESLLKEAARQGGPSVRILRMSRCFPEPANVMAAFRLHRGIDARDVASAHALALTHAGGACETFVISGETPFQPADCSALWHDAPSVLAQRCPELADDYGLRGWPLPQRIDRVYCAAAAIREMGWRPQHGYASVLRALDEESAEVLYPNIEAKWAAD
jgi:nucleoside-diphosphate-sugar epimerase